MVAGIGMYGHSGGLGRRRSLGFLVSRSKIARWAVGWVRVLWEV